MIILKLFENLSYVSLIEILLFLYMTYYYYKYFNCINPLPGPFPFPFFGNIPQLFILHGGNLKILFNSNHKKYGDVFEVQFDTRIIALNRTEQVEKLLLASTRNPYITTVSESSIKVLNELEIMGRRILFNQDVKLIVIFFTQAILSPKFSHEAIYWTNKLFNEMESYWDKLGDNKKVLDFSTWSNQFTNDMIITLLTGERSYTMAAYFNEHSDDVKAERPSALIDETVTFVHAISKYMMVFLIFQIIPPFLRHYFSYFKNKSDDLIQNLKYLNKRVDSIIKRRRQEIENTPSDKPLPKDTLTFGNYNEYTS
jgi:hypothetical protein